MTKFRRSKFALAFTATLVAAAACTPEYSLGSNGLVCDGGTCADAFEGDADSAMGSRCESTDALPELPVGVAVVGDTRAERNETSASCGGAFGSENVWRVTLPRRARITVDLTPAGEAPLFDAAVSLRQSCSDLASEKACAHYVSDVGSSSLRIPDASAPPLPAGTYFVLVDGLAGSRGTYAIQVNATWVALEHESCGVDSAIDATVVCDDPSAFACGCGVATSCSADTCEIPAPNCGDGIVGPGEACDSHNDDTQYCLPSCDEVPRDCPPLAPQPALVSGQHYVGSTSLNGSHFASESCGGAAAGDIYFRLHVPAPGAVARVRVSEDVSSPGPFRVFATLRKECPADLGAHDLDCGSEFTHVFRTGDEGDYFVWVDGMQGDSGVYDLVVDTVTLQPVGAPCTDTFVGPDATFIELAAQCASGFCFDGTDIGSCADKASPPSAICGDGMISGSETCDDRNRTNGDGCSASCRLESRTCRPTEDLEILPANGEVVGSTTGQSTTTDTACGGGRSGEDRFAIHLDSRSRLIVSTANSTTEFATSVDVRSACVEADETDALACARTTTGTGATVVLEDVPAGDYFVTVDGVFGATGNYALSSTVIALSGHGELCQPDNRVPDRRSMCAETSDRCLESGVNEYRCQ